MDLASPRDARCQTWNRKSWPSEYKARGGGERQKGAREKSGAILGSDVGTPEPGFLLGKRELEGEIWIMKFIGAHRGLPCTTSGGKGSTKAAWTHNKWAWSRWSVRLMIERWWFGQG